MNDAARPRRPFLTILMLVVCAVFAALVIDRYFVLEARLQRLERSAEHTALALDRLKSRRLTRSELARAEGAWSVRFATLAAGEKRLVRALAKLRALGPGRRSELVATVEARELLAFARAEDRIAVRPRATAALLRAAARLLASAHDPALVAVGARLRQAAALRARLAAFPYARALRALEAVRRGLGRWPEITSSVTPHPRPPTPVVHGFWAKIWSAVLRFVHATVRVERIPSSRERARTLSLAERERLREDIGLELATARLALAVRDPVLFRSLASSALRRVRLLYDTRNPEVARATAALGRVIALPPPPRPPSLAPLRRALVAAESALART